MHCLPSKNNRPQGGLSLNRIVIDEEFKKLIPALDEEELRQLKENILRDGCRDPLVVWDETDILLDGYHRHAICVKESRHFNLVRLSFIDRLDAREWIWTNQLGRRNLSAEMIAYVRGNLYETRKEQGRRSDLTSGHTGPKLGERTSEQLAEEHNVGEHTIRRDAAFATAVDAIAETAGEDARRLILSGESGLTRERIKELAIEAPDKIQFEMEVRGDVQRLAAAREDQGLTAEEVAEGNRVTRATRGNRTLKMLDDVSRLTRAFSQFSTFVVKFRGSESADEALGGWNRKFATWLHEQVDLVIAEMRGWQTAIEKKFPEVRRHGGKLKAVR